MNKSIFNTSICVGILLCACSAFLLREEAYVLTGDDLLYSFILDDKPLGSNIYTEKVNSVADAVVSQGRQYFFSNGRTLIHIPVQLFAGLYGGGGSKKAFEITSTLIFAVTMLAFMRLSLPAHLRRSPLMMLCVAVTFLYLFQNGARLFYSITGTFNYLYPMLAVSFYLLLYRRIYSAPGGGHSCGRTALCVIAGIIAGWSQECFSLPLSVSLLACYLIARKKQRHIPREMRILLFSLWCGTFILCAAPGNFLRVLGMGDPVTVFLRALDYYSVTPLFWLAAAAMAGLRLKGKIYLRDFYRNHSIMILSWIASCAMGCVVNTLPQSFSGISFFSALVLFSSLRYFIKEATGIRATTIAVLLSGLLMYHQMMIVRDARRLADYHKKIIAQVNADGRPLKLHRFHASPLTAPFLNVWTESAVFSWIHFSLHVYYAGHITYPESLLKDSVTWTDG